MGVASGELSGLGPGTGPIVAEASPPAVTGFCGEGAGRSSGSTGNSLGGRSLADTNAAKSAANDSSKLAQLLSFVALLDGLLLLVNSKVAQGSVLPTWTDS